MERERGREGGEEGVCEEKGGDDVYMNEGF